VSRRRARQRAATLPAADRELFAAYLKFAAAYQKAMEADAAPGRDKGSVDSGTPEQKKAYRKWERALSRSDNLVHRFVAMPANTIEGMPLKIQVARWRMEQPGKGFKPLIDGPDWTLIPDFPGDELPLLAGLRGDLRRFSLATAA